jgi:hypothetical protein
MHPVQGSLDKKGGKFAIFYLAKDVIFLRLFCLTNWAQVNSTIGIKIHVLASWLVNNLSLNIDALHLLNIVHSYIVTVTSLVTIVTNDHLQLSACNEVMEITRLFKHQERYNHYNILGAQVRGMM